MSVPFDNLDEKDMIATLNEGTHLMNTLQDQLQESKNLLVNIKNSFRIFRFFKVGSKHD